MWKRTGREERRAAGSGGPPFHRPPAGPQLRASLTFEFLFPEAIELLLVHVHLDGSEVGHDGQEVFEVYLVRQPIRRLPQVPAESGAAGDGQPGPPGHLLQPAMSLGKALRLVFSPPDFA